MDRRASSRRRRSARRPEASVKAKAIAGADDRHHPKAAARVAEVVLVDHASSGHVGVVIAFFAER
jgi:hypothetical protein